MRYWWVNQNQTYRHEVPGGYLWSPKTRKDGQRHHFYDTMTEVRPGDLVLSFADTLIKAIGVVQAAAATAVKPTEFGSAGSTWADEGWYVEVEFSELSSPIRPKDHMALLGPLLPAKYSPLQATGDGNQVVYLTELPQDLALALGRLVGSEFSRVSSLAAGVTPDEEDELAETALLERADLAATHKLQLIRARRGQGLFRSRVELLEPSCRVTGLEERQHLRASHILPWRLATDSQKLDGCNGLMLSPHVDHLFDKGFISFEDDGGLLVSPLISGEVLKAWSLPSVQMGRAFSPEQSTYLAYHRAHLFRR
jgi:putative restriction endonuclease